MILIVWGGKDWKGDLWPHPKCPAWANNAAKRMVGMGVEKARIQEVLKEMRNGKIILSQVVGDRTYDFLME
jgi:hypothetical protein